MPNEIKAVRQTLKINETGEELPAVALLITGSFEKILNHIYIVSKGEYDNKIDIISDAMYKGSHLLPDEMQFVEETLEADDDSGRKIDAVAVIINEAFKKRLDAIITISNNRINSYEKAITDAIFKGIDEILKKYSSAN